MLREVKKPWEAELIIYREAIWTPEELAEELELRFLVDDPEEDEEEIEEDADEDPEEDEPEEEQPKRRTKAQIIELITEALSDGNKSVPEIMDATGLSYNVVKRYLRKMEEL